MAADQVGRRVPGQRLAPNVTGQFNRVREPAAEPRPLHAKRWRFSDGENEKCSTRGGKWQLVWPLGRRVACSSQGRVNPKDTLPFRLPGTRPQSESQVLVQLY